MLRLRLRLDADIGLGRLPTLRILLLGVVVADRTCDDHVLAELPIHRRRHLVLGCELQRVDHAQHLVEISAGGHRIDQNELDLLVYPMTTGRNRSEEHTSELQSRQYLVCRLLLEKKKKSSQTYAFCSKWRQIAHPDHP